MVVEEVLSKIIIMGKVNWGECVIKYILGRSFCDELVSLRTTNMGPHVLEISISDLWVEKRKSVLCLKICLF